MIYFLKIFIYSVLICSLIFTIISIPSSYAQTIPITKSDYMNKVIFDGKWTFVQEWKPTSLTTIDTPSGTIYIRSAHQGNSIYVLVDSAFDTKPVSGSDRASVCFDSNINKTAIAALPWARAHPSSPRRPRPAACRRASRGPRARRVPRRGARQRG